jgi:hypothetical protein
MLLQAVTPTALTEAVCGVPLEEAAGSSVPSIATTISRRGAQRPADNADRVRAAGTLPTLTVRECAAAGSTPS